MAGVLEALTEEEAYLLAILTDPSGVDQAEFLWHAPDQNHQGCFRAWDYQYRWWRSMDKQQIDQCIPEGALVLTERGHIPIEDVEIGDRVWTDQGCWRPVTYKWDKGEQPVVQVRGYGHHEFVATADHKVFTDRGMVAAGELAGERWLSPIVNDGSGGLPTFERAYASGRANLPTVDEWNFPWLCGLFAAEGSLSSTYGRGGKLNRITWSVHVDEVTSVEDALTALGLNFNTDSPSANCRNVRVICEPLAVMFEEFGRGASNKRVPGWVFKLPREQKLRFVEGMLAGDGHYRQGRCEYTTVSKSLAFDLKVLANALQMSASVCVARDAGEMRIEGRVVNTKKTYCVTVQELGTQARPRLKREAVGFSSYVSRVDELPEVVRCYDLEVEADHSFCVEGVVVSNCARSAGKSLSIQVRACAFPILHASQEMVITAPEGNHLQAVTDLVETRLKHNRFYSELLLANASNGITHRPFLAKFRNGARIMGRIPQRDGRGVKGVHPLWLEMDEAQDYPSPGWTEIIETLKQEDETSDNARWRAHGVTKGIRDEFWKFTQPGSDWKVHRYTAMWRPTWSDKERQEKINMYGSANHPDYRRNVLGLHGDVANPLFVLTRLMRCVDLDPASDYNQNIYHRIAINAEMIEDRGGDVLSAIDLSMSHRKYKTTWAGMDIGLTTDPTEILVFSEDEKAPDKEHSLLRLVSRFRLERVSIPDQVKVVLWLCDFYNLNGFGMDKTGLGVGLFQFAQEMAEQGVPEAVNVIRKETIKGYNFSEKVLVDFDESVPVDQLKGDIVEEAGIKRNVLEYSTDKLREYVDTRRLMLPDDRELIQEFQGQTFTYDKGGMDMYGRRRFSKGSFHALDAARMAAMAHAQHEIETFMRDYEQVKKPEPVYDIFVPIG